MKVEKAGGEENGAAGWGKRPLQPKSHYVIYRELDVVLSYCTSMLERSVAAHKVQLKNRYFIIGAATGCLIAAATVTVVIAQPSAETTPSDSLSFTPEQVTSGQSEYITSCVDCHGPNLNDGEFGGPPLKGDAFRAKWFGHPVSALVAFTNAAMPPDAAGRLPLGTYVEIIAYLLNANGINPGPRELPSDMVLLAKLRIPATNEDAGKSH